MDLVEAAVRGGDTGLARDMLDEIGMAAFAERARRELTATGEKLLKRGADTDTVLTEQEACIARLAREGRTNPEIGMQLYLSARTVEWHLRKVFTKLGISSRRELRAEDVWIRLLLSGPLPFAVVVGSHASRHACDCCQVGESMGRPAAWAASSRRLS